MVVMVEDERVHLEEGAEGRAADGAVVRLVPGGGEGGGEAVFMTVMEMEPEPLFACHLRLSAQVLQRQRWRQGRMSVSRISDMQTTHSAPVSSTSSSPRASV